MTLTLRSKSTFYVTADLIFVFRQILLLCSWNVRLKVFNITIFQHSFCFKLLFLKWTQINLSLPLLSRYQWDNCRTQQRKKVSFSVWIQRKWSLQMYYGGFFRSSVVFYFEPIFIWYLRILLLSTLRYKTLIYSLQLL